MTAPGRELKPGFPLTPTYWRRTALWLLVALLTLLSIDWWAWEDDRRLGGWLPAWVLYLMALQFALALVLWRLGRETQP